MADKSLSEKMAVASETQASTHPVRETDPKDDSEQKLHLSAMKPMVDAQPKKKGTFKITNVMKNDADGDSMDDLDESHTEVTEDVSSDILDISRATDNGQDTPSEDIVFQGLSNEMDAKENKDKTGSDMHSRFRVVKIETKEPFFRGRWRCHDYLDTMQVMSERSDTKLAEEGNSGSSSAASSIHYVHGVDDPSKNPLLSDACGTVPVPNETQNVVKHESFQPIHPAPVSMNNGTLVVPAFFQENPAVTGISSQSQKFIQHSNSQQNIPQTAPVLADSSQNLQQGQLTQSSHVPQQPLFMATPTQIGTVAELVPNIAVASIGIPSMPSIYPTIQSMSQLPSVVSSVSGTTNMAHPQVATSTYQTFVHPDNQTLPVSHSGHLEHVNVSGLIPTSQISKATFSDSPVSTFMPFTNAVQVLDRDLKDTVLQNTPLLTPLSVGDSAEEPDDSGSSTVAIDNKIEQAMDLVKSHLMYAVREEVEVLKEQIKELTERNNQLELENSILIAAASQETISKLAQLKPQAQQQSLS